MERKSVEMDLLVKEIRIDGGTQARWLMRKDKIAEYAKGYRKKDKIPPIVVFNDGENIWLSDGFHRFAGKIMTGDAKINCEVYSGTQRDAQIYAAKANSHHGIHRTRADKKKSAMLILQDAEWHSATDREIANACDIETEIVTELRKEQKTRHERPGRRRRRDTAEDEPVEEVAEAAEEEEAPAEKGLLVDDNGREVPERLKDHFLLAARFQYIERTLLRQLRAVSRDIHNALWGDDAEDATSNGRTFHYKPIWEAADQIYNITTPYKPSYVCQHCVGEGCNICNHKGYLTQKEKF